MMKKWHLRKLEDWDDIIPQIWEQAKANNIWLLSGNLGAGKTTFVTKLMKYLGSSDLVSSPTFAIHQSYDFDQKTAHHLDLYRLETVEELQEIGFFDLIEQGELMLIEWPDVAVVYFDIPVVQITLEHTDVGRIVTLNVQNQK